MQAKDVMTIRVVTVKPDTTVSEIAKQLLSRHISAVPVVNNAGQVVGIVSEGDLMRRHESGTERHRSWWLALIAMPEDQARDYTRSHGQHAEDVMSRDVISVSEETSLDEIATILERRHIKRVPVVHEGKLVGIVSRANLLHGLIARKTGGAVSADDRAIRAELEQTLKEVGVRTQLLSFVVSSGVVHLWGSAWSEEEKNAVRAAAESTPGVRQIENNIRVLSDMVRTFYGAE